MVGCLYELDRAPLWWLKYTTGAFPPPFGHFVGGKSHHSNLILPPCLPARPGEIKLKLPSVSYLADWTPLKF